MSPNTRILSVRNIGVLAKLLDGNVLDELIGSRPGLVPCPNKWGSNLFLVPNRQIVLALFVEYIPNDCKEPFHLPDSIFPFCRFFAPHGSRLPTVPRAHSKLPVYHFSRRPISRSLALVTSVRIRLPPPLPRFLLSLHLPHDPDASDTLLPQPLAAASPSPSKSPSCRRAPSRRRSSRIFCAIPTTKPVPLARTSRPARSSLC